jgi:hypothetical protein
MPPRGGPPTGDGGVDTGPSFWRAFGDRGLAFEPSKKDFLANRDEVGTRLRPRKITTPSEGIKEQSQIVIYDTRPELIHELSSYRYPTLSTVQVTKQDPSETLTVRCHLVDRLL